MQTLHARTLAAVLMSLFALSVPAQERPEQEGAAAPADSAADSQAATPEALTYRFHVGGHDAFSELLPLPEPLFITGPQPDGTGDGGAAPTATTGKAGGSSSAADLAKQLSNPIAALISVPFQFNWDRNIGPLDDGDRVFMNMQPVVPISLNEEWNLISRTILPVTAQWDIFPGAGDQFGLGDLLQSMWFSPVKPTAGGWIWGVGPAALLPTATDDLLGSGKWGLGPTAIVLRQDKGWTYGILANQVWSVFGDDDRPDLSNMFLQPFLAFTTPDAWTFGLNTESTYDWRNDVWGVPINGQVSKLVHMGKQPVSLQAGAGYWVESTPGGPEGFRFRLTATWLFPRAKK